ncbi:MAG: Pr6Pr family membrane protein [Bacteroidetes bacterium]|nr:Pr6Pr family membrane protein [Bacteroidota bacterium]
MRIYSALGGIIGWFAVITQFFLMLENRVAPITETIMRFLSFFTILTNTLVALTFTFIAINSSLSIKKFLSKQTTLAATCVYIVVVGLIYNLILRSLWQPTGMQKIVDELLHSVMPVVFLLFWIIFIPKSKLKWGSVFPWLLYPFFYAIFVAIRGAFSGFYPYPFIDVTKIGYAKFFINSLLITVLFLFLSLLLVGITKIFTNKAAV